jgi:hypothetical protein
MLFLTANRPRPPQALARMRLRPKFRELTYAYGPFAFLHVGRIFPFHRKETYPVFIHLSGQQYRNERARTLRKRLGKALKSRRDCYGLTTEL